MRNNLICTSSRLSNANINDVNKYLVLLPINSCLTFQIINNFHFEYFHAGVNSVLSHLRERLWLPQGRQIVRGVLRKYVPCIKQTGKAYPQPFYANLLKERVCEARPFQACRVDYTGAVHLNDNTKVYILLFTCAVTLAVHLELGDDLTEEEFLFAFRRFVSRRSFPQVIFSDNELTFQSASKTLRNYFLTIKLNGSSSLPVDLGRVVSGRD